MIETSALCSSGLHCVFQFQNLLSGFLAVLAAVGTAFVIWRATSLPVSHQREREKISQERRRNHGCLLLSSEMQTLGSRAHQAGATIRVVAAENHEVTDTVRQKTFLALPTVIENWEVMSLLPPEIVQLCLSLGRKIDDHNFDIARAGTFVDERFRRIILERIGAVGVNATQVRQAIANLQAPE